MLLAHIAAALGDKTIRRWVPPRERLEDMFGQALPETPELRRLRVASMTGSDADLFTAEAAAEDAEGEGG